ADKQGLYFQPSQGTAENYFLSTGELLQLKAVAECIASGRSGAITVNQVVWKESYTYDPNGNRTSKTTSWGTVQYAYDKENRLTESGNLGMSESVKYTYDANGNLLRESAARYRKDYTYNAQNRMSFSNVQDSVLNTRNFTEYAYDAFGRRIETKQYLGDYTRNLYDGFSFDIIGKSVLQSAYSANIPEQMYRTPSTQRHPELVSGSTSNGRNERGTEIGTRYRYIDDTPLVPMAEAGKANGTNAASSANGAKTRSRSNNEYVLYSYGEPVAMSADGNASYFGTDILGSVRSVTDKYGTVQADYSYDAFGSPYLGNLENDIGFGYCGKVYDNGTGLYDYGFRDYSPNSARFTTVDPIRDGANWFSYVVNDPVNYVDPFGLKSNDVKNYEYLGEWGGEKHYKAKSGATKWGLARDTGHDVKDVKGYDGDPTKMPIGTELSIPSNSGSTPSESTQITATPPSNAQTTVGTTNAVVTQPSAPAVPMTQSSAPAVSNGAQPQPFSIISNAEARIQANAEALNYYYAERAKLDIQLGELDQKIGKLHNQLVNYFVDYVKQEISDTISLWNIFKDVLPTGDITQISIQDLAEFCVDFFYSFDSRINIPEIYYYYFGTYLVNLVALNNERKGIVAQINDLQNHIEETKQRIKDDTHLVLSLQYGN
ncbi:MAG: hypothetical protein PUF61_11160, partial [Spirochaetales bacterium]|nr:hypothetical protein [Spirochaetales bacterium]